MKFIIGVQFIFCIIIKGVAFGQSVTIVPTDTGNNRFATEYQSVIRQGLSLNGFDNTGSTSSGFFEQDVQLLFPDHLAPHLLLGEIYYRLGNIEKSKESLQKCIEMNTRIISPDVKQIRSNALMLWNEFYGKYNF